MLPEVIAGVGAAAFVYHHAGYPLLLRRLAARARARGASSARPMSEGELPAVTVIVPVHNEAAVIGAKVAMLGALDYPRDRLRCIVVCDGSTDASAEVAREAARRLAPGLVTVVEHAANRGKVAVLNETIAGVMDEIVALTDASAGLAPDAVRRAVRQFADAEVGVVCPSYVLPQGSPGEERYWRYQTAIKADEAALGAPMGAHGAFYLFRRSLWKPLAADTINDDVMLPMGIVAQGYRAVYDRSIAAIELERATAGQDFKRRIRIGAGNLQQVLRLWRLADPRRPGLAFVFLSGKALRCLAPLLAIASAVSCLYLLSGSLLIMSALAMGLSASVMAVYATAGDRSRQPRPLALLGYVVEGHTASLLGALGYLAGRHSRPWGKAVACVDDVTFSQSRCEEAYVPRSVAISKRAFDVLLALGALLVLAVLIIPLAIAIKLDSRGPIFYRQLRVGRCSETATHMFHLIKLRTMRTDSEAKGGAVWATKDDPRITRVGRFLRKTRLDELPQAINVLRGEMSVVGPRPERPSFFRKLEDAIPFYVERTYGLRPGITGFAQVNQAYDQTIEDVRNKVLYDHAYAAHLSRWTEWLKADVGILFKTISVMALGKGQ